MQLRRPLDAAMLRGVVLALALLPVAAGAQPARPERLTGEMFLGGATLVDPPPGEPSGTHAYLSLTGAAARRIFDAMPGPATADSCRPGRRVKRSGHLTCMAGRGPSDVRCDLAIALVRGELAPGTPC